MRTVVMVSHLFPPEGNAGVYRSLRFVRHLTSYGWRPVVIAADPYCYVRYDPGLLGLVPPATEVVKVRNPDPWAAIQQRRSNRFKEKVATESVETVRRIQASHERPMRAVLREALRRVESAVYRPDPSMLWIRPATEAATQACKRTGAEVVWATGGPWSSLVVARNTSLRTGLPYVLDLRDSWTLTHSDFEVRQPEWIKARDRRLLCRLFSGAQAVVLRYMSEAEAYWRAYPGSFDPERIHLIPNGYDGAVAPFEVSRGDRCTILFTGFIGPYWYDDLLSALAQLKASEPGIARRLRLVFVGEGTEDIAGIAGRLGLSDIIETSAALSFAEVNQMQSQAHALLLLGWKPARGHELGGSKIFGYLQSGRPIVGVLPRDEQTRILRSVGVETVAYAGAPNEIISVFKRLISAWSSGDLASLLPNRVACETYSAERQTGALVRALEGLPALDGFRPGVAAAPPSLEEFFTPGGWVKHPRVSRTRPGTSTTTSPAPTSEE